MKRAQTTHWVWQPYSTEPGMAFATRIEGMEADEYGKLIRGERLDPKIQLVVKELIPGRLTDQLGSAWGGIFVSPVLRAVLEAEASANIQFIPVRVTRHSAHPYFSVNVLDSLPVLDLERSKYTLYEGTNELQTLSKLVLRKLPPDAPAIFHMAEEPVIVLVSADLHRRLHEASDSPGRFVPVEKFKLGGS